MGGPVRHVMYQAKKEDDGFDQVTHGREAPGEGRVDFIMQHLPPHLKDPHFASGKGNSQGKIRFSQSQFDTNGVKIPWYGSKINSMPQGAKQVRQHTGLLYINDECAFQDEFRASMIAAAQNMKKMICLSSVDSGSYFNEAVLNIPGGGEPKHTGIHPVVKVGMDLWGIEWPNGLRSWQTKSGSWVLETKYTADPKKDPARDGAEWHRKAVLKEGYEGDYDSDGWQTEMEINYKRGGGSPVFPQCRIDTPVFIDSFKPADIMDKMRFFAGYDYGARNPSAFEVWGIDKDNKAYAVWELYEPCTNIAVHVERIKRCPYWDRLEVIACDPSIMSKTQQGAADIKTLGELFEDHGLNLTRGRRGQDVSIAQLFNSDYWANADKPDAFITKSCPGLMQEVMDLRWDKHVSEALNVRKNAPEKIRDKNNHAWDATATVFDYGVQPFIPEVIKPTAGTYKQAVADLRLASAREQIRKGGIHVR